MHGLPRDRRRRQEQGRPGTQRARRPPLRHGGGLFLLGCQQAFRHHLERGPIQGLHQGPQGEDSRYQDGIRRHQEREGSRRSLGVSRAIRQGRKDQAAVDIPTSIFSEQAGKPEAGYGGRFLTSDRRADLTVQSVPNDAGFSPAVFLARKNPPRDIVYKKVTPRFLVVSSFRKEKIWYNRCNFAGRFINCVLINYPAAEKRQWDSVVTRISDTLA